MDQELLVWVKQPLSRTPLTPALSHSPLTPDPYSESSTPAACLSASLTWLVVEVEDAVVGLQQVRVAGGQVPADGQRWGDLLGLFQAYDTVILRLAHTNITAQQIRTIRQFR